METSGLQALTVGEPVLSYSFGGLLRPSHHTKLFVRYGKNTHWLRDAPVWRCWLAHRAVDGAPPCVD